MFRRRRLFFLLLYTLVVIFLVTTLMGRQCLYQEHVEVADRSSHDKGAENSIIELTKGSMQHESKPRVYAQHEAEKPALPVDHQKLDTESDHWKKTTDQCRAAFYDGFTEKVPVCSSAAEENSCYFHPLLKASICDLRDVVIRREHIQVAAGNESIVSVANRRQRDELPVYSQGAFGLSCELALRKSVQKKFSFYHIERVRYFPHHTEDMVDGFAKDPNPRNCSITITEPMFAITRWNEYLSIYWSMTYWYNVFQVARVFNLPLAQIRVVLFDGHSQSAMDTVWTHVFNAQYISATPKDTCYKRMFIVHAGYSSPLSNDGSNFGSRFLQRNCRADPHVLEFSKFILQSFSVKDPPAQPGKFDILFILRRDYLAHPRNMKGLARRKIANEDAVLARLRKELPNESFNILPRYFDSMPMRDQLQLVRNATVVIGMHGAGLSHILFARPKVTRFLELRDPKHAKRHTFMKFAEFIDVPYHRIDVGMKDKNDAHLVDTGILAKTVRSFFRFNEETSQYELDTDTEYEY